MISTYNVSFVIISLTSFAFSYSPAVVGFDYWLERTTASLVGRTYATDNRSGVLCAVRCPSRQVSVAVSEKNWSFQIVFECLAAV